MKTFQSDAVVIGAGFFGLSTAIYLREELGFNSVIILESEDDAMERASFVNQARVHNGYHYPRSILTGFRSRKSSDNWINDYSDATYPNFKHIYGISKQLGKVSAKQFESFCNRIGAPLKEVSDLDQQLFQPKLIEKVWEVEEIAFDSRKLRAMVLARAEKLGGIKILYKTTATKVKYVSGQINVYDSMGRKFVAKTVISCVYARVNELHRNSGLDLVPLQLEVAEMALVKMPQRLQTYAFTIMDGPFFSVMPFPSAGLHSFSHVRYTPHYRWEDSSTSPGPRRVPSVQELNLEPSNFRQMLADATRFIPELRNLEYVRSIIEVKAVLTQQDSTDARPILIRTATEIPGYICVLGEKLTT